MENIVCVELHYKALKSDCELGPFIGPGPSCLGAIVLSSTILQENKLQKCVNEVCQRMNWVPLVYRIVEDSKPKISLATAVYEALTK